MPESLRSFFDELETPDRHLALPNRSSPDPVRTLLDSLFDGHPVSISRDRLSDLVRRETR